jgi:hypothetical protein
MIEVRRMGDPKQQGLPQDYGALLWTVIKASL